MVSKAVFDGAAPGNFLGTLLNVLRPRGPFRAVILAEFSQKYACAVWLKARLHRAPCVVDGFVGLYETVVEDRGSVPRHSLRARAYRAFDGVALRLSDVFLTDTEIRAENARRLSRTTEVISLPVGAPPWARPTPGSPGPPADEKSLRVLYYGNFIPLHGVEYAVRAVLALARTRSVSLTLVGDLTRQPALAAELARSPQRDAVVVAGRVPESSLRDLIAEHDVILGIFGTSPKAATVIANKVWQPLACGKPVLTRHSTALAELNGLVGELVVTVEPGSAAAIEQALASTDWRSLGAPPDVADRLERYVDQCYDQLGERLLHTAGR